MTKDLIIKAVFNIHSWYKFLVVSLVLVTIPPSAIAKVPAGIGHDNGDEDKNVQTCSVVLDAQSAGLKLRNVVDNKKYDEILKCLDKLRLPAGHELKVRVAEHIGGGDVSRLYVTLPGDKASLHIFDYIKVENSPAGAMQAYLLSNTWYYLPLYWHANYNKRSYVYSSEDIKNIEIRYENEEQRSKIIEELLSSGIDVSPTVKTQNGKFYVSCCYWSDFGGLFRETAEIKIKNNKLVKLSDQSEEPLYEYRCRVVY